MTVYLRGLTPFRAPSEPERNQEVFEMKELKLEPEEKELSEELYPVS
jgi:hypothetical protein